MSGVPESAVGDHYEVSRGVVTGDAVNKVPASKVRTEVLLQLSRDKLDAATNHIPKYLRDRGTQSANVRHTLDSIDRIRGKMDEMSACFYEDPVSGLKMTNTFSAMDKLAELNDEALDVLKTFFEIEIELPGGEKEKKNQFESRGDVKHPLYADFAFCEMYEGLTEGIQHMMSNFSGDLRACGYDLSVGKLGNLQGQYRQAKQRLELPGKRGSKKKMYSKRIPDSAGVVQVAENKTVDEVNPDEFAAVGPIPKSAYDPAGEADVIVAKKRAVVPGGKDRAVSFDIPPDLLVEGEFNLDVFAAGAERFFDDVERLGGTGKFGEYFTGFVVRVLRTHIRVLKEKREQGVRVDALSVFSDSFMSALLQIRRLSYMSKTASDGDVLMDSFYENIIGCVPQSWVPEDLYEGEAEMLEDRNIVLGVAKYFVSEIFRAESPLYGNLDLLNRLCDQVFNQSRTMMGDAKEPFSMFETADFNDDDSFYAVRDCVLGLFPSGIPELPPAALQKEEDGGLLKFRAVDSKYQSDFAFIEQARTFLLEIVPEADSSKMQSLARSAINRTGDVMGTAASEGSSQRWWKTALRAVTSSVNCFSRVNPALFDVISSQYSRVLGFYNDLGFSDEALPEEITASDICDVIDEMTDLVEGQLQRCVCSEVFVPQENFAFELDAITPRGLAGSAIGTFQHAMAALEEATTGYERMQGVADARSRVLGVSRYVLLEVFRAGSPLYGDMRLLNQVNDRVFHFDIRSVDFLDYQSVCAERTRLEGLFPQGVVSLDPSELNDGDFRENIDIYRLDPDCEKFDIDFISTTLNCLDNEILPEFRRSHAVGIASGCLNWAQDSASVVMEEKRERNQGWWSALLTSVNNSLLGIKDVDPRLFATVEGLNAEVTVFIDRLRSYDEALPKNVKATEIMRTIDQIVSQLQVGIVSQDRVQLVVAPLSGEHLVRESSVYPNRHLSEAVRFRKIVIDRYLELRSQPKPKPFWKRPFVQAVAGGMAVVGLVGLIAKEAGDLFGVGDDAGKNDDSVAGLSVDKPVVEAKIEMPAIEEIEAMHLRHIETAAAVASDIVAQKMSSNPGSVKSVKAEVVDVTNGMLECGASVIAKAILPIRDDEHMYAALTGMAHGYGYDMPSNFSDAHTFAEFEAIGGDSATWDSNTRSAWLQAGAGYLTDLQVSKIAAMYLNNGCNPQGTFTPPAVPQGAASLPTTSDGGSASIDNSHSDSGVFAAGNGGDIGVYDFQAARIKALREKPKSVASVVVVPRTERVQGEQMDMAMFDFPGLRTRFLKKRREIAIGKKA